ncbi:MAG: succinate dehydrogenase assembly factor 2 [Halomonas sp.]|nr:succinate dehydrogenase assembly factor 2 [Halomonas sp.]
MAVPAAAVDGGLGYTVGIHPTGKARSTLNEQSPQDVVLRKRLHWHSRRGMWELDLLLVPFLEQRYDHLDEADQAAFRELIDEEDQDLFMWLMRRELPEDPRRRRIVQLIIEHAESADSIGHRPV